MRATIANAFEQITKLHGYTIWACAVLSNHAHLCVRQHKRHYEAVWRDYADGARNRVAPTATLSCDHPLWANRPYSVYLHTPSDIRRTINYIENNPVKEGLPAQRYEWVQSYDGWPENRAAIHR